MHALTDGTVTALTRSDCRDEWLAVLNYPHLPVTSENRGQIVGDFNRYIACTAAEAKTATKLPLCSDKDDQKFLELARDVGADILITKDKALLKLARKTRNSGLYDIQTPERFLSDFTPCKNVIKT